MDKYIERVRDKCRCRANVVFGKYQDLVSLFVAAHKKKYKAEWIVGNSLAGSVDDVVREMIAQHKITKTGVHEVLEGTCSINTRTTA